MSREATTALTPHLLQMRCKQVRSWKHSKRMFWKWSVQGGRRRDLLDSITEFLINRTLSHIVFSFAPPNLFLTTLVVLGLLSLCPWVMVHHCWTWSLWGPWQILFVGIAFFEVVPSQLGWAGWGGWRQWGYKYEILGSQVGIRVFTKWHHTTPNILFERWMSIIRQRASFLLHLFCVC